MLLRVACVVCALVLAGCREKPPQPVLPLSSEMVEDRLVIVMHGYISSGKDIAPLVEGLAHHERRPYHVHSFDFGAFSRVGHSHNAGVEELSDAFSAFYAELPERCPVCAERAERPVEVTVVARSLGGLITRETLMDGADAARAPWRVERVVTLSTPFFGSVMTRFSTGFLSIVLNGFVRTALFGFVNPERGGNFGRVVDEQIRALRLGSPYLWGSHMRWREHTASSSRVPDWLTVLAMGSPKPELRGDGVMRLAAGNIAPLLPGTGTEALLLDVLHSELFNKPCEGHEARELALALTAIRRFIEDGSLAREPSLALHTLARGADGRLLLEKTSSLPADAEPLPQTFYLQPDGADREEKLADLSRILSKDAGDLWLRFYTGRPGAPGHEIVLSRHLSAFQQGPEWAWQELDATYELDASGRHVPTTMTVGPTHSHLIHIPDVAPTGDWGLQVRLVGGIALPADWVWLDVQGGDETRAEGVDWSPLHIAPLQPNLVRVFIDEDAVRAAHPELGALEIAEVSLEPLHTAAPMLHNEISLRGD